MTMTGPPAGTSPPGASPPDPVLYALEGGVAVITLNRPEVLNAIDAVLVERLIAILEQAAADPTCRAVVLTGAGRGFCAGGNVRALAAPPSPSGEADTDPGERSARTRALMRATELLYGMPKVTIAAVNGPCAGAGLSLACATDLRYAASSAIFTSAFVRVG